LGEAVRDPPSGDGSISELWAPSELIVTSGRHNADAGFPILVWLSEMSSVTGKVQSVLIVTIVPASH
jgi:hypothetical protein